MIFIPQGTSVHTSWQVGLPLVLSWPELPPDVLLGCLLLSHFPCSVLHIKSMAQNQSAWPPEESGIVWASAPNFKTVDRSSIQKIQNAPLTLTSSNFKVEFSPRSVASRRRSTRSCSGNQLRPPHCHRSLLVIPIHPCRDCIVQRTVSIVSPSWSIHPLRLTSVSPLLLLRLEDGYPVFSPTCIKLPFSGSRAGKLPRDIFPAPSHFTLLASRSIREVTVPVLLDWIFRLLVFLRLA